MQVVKKINNNVAVCIDSEGHELIAFGKGIGFPATPYELNDLSKVERTYYGIEPRNLDLFKTVTNEEFEVSQKIVDVARSRIQGNVNSNVVFTLADHIHFAVQRQKEKIYVKMPTFYDLPHLYPIETEIGQYALKLIQRDLKVRLPKEEADSIALHFINSETMKSEEEHKVSDDEIIDQITVMIELFFGIEIDKEGFNYSRFATHMQYLLKRTNTSKQVSSSNMKIFESMKEEYAKTYACVQDICGYLKQELQWDLNEEEQLYLMLHVNRLCAREDCNR